MILVITLAIVIGKIIQKFIPERLITLLGGIAFICFGIWELFFGILYKDVIKT